MSLWDPEPHSCLDFAWGLLCFGGLSLAIGAVVRLLCWLEMVT